MVHRFFAKSLPFSGLLQQFVYPFLDQISASKNVPLYNSPRVKAVLDKGFLLRGQKVEFGMEVTCVSGNKGEII